MRSAFREIAVGELNNLIDESVANFREQKPKVGEVPDVRLSDCPDISNLSLSLYFRGEFPFSDDPPSSLAGSLIAGARHAPCGFSRMLDADRNAETPEKPMWCPRDKPASPIDLCRRPDLLLVWNDEMLKML